MLTLLEYLSRKYRRPFGEVNLALLSERGIRDLHKRYLKKDQPTDVLTFGDHQTDCVAGDIALSPYRVLLYAFHDCRNPVSWFYHSLLHGLLHLYGLEHDYSKGSLEKVYQLQTTILKKNRLVEESINDIFEKIILFSSQVK